MVLRLHLPNITLNAQVLSYLAIHFHNKWQLIQLEIPWNVTQIAVTFQKGELVCKFKPAPLSMRETTNMHLEPMVIS